jgi:TatD DNase family protein
MNVGCSIETSVSSIALAKRYDFIYASVGIHPHETKDQNNQSEKTIRELAKHEKVVEIGEIGLDYYYDNSPREVQKEWFRKQIKIAKDINLPIIIHTRDAMHDTMEIVRSENAKTVGGVFHCYSSSVEMVDKVLENNFFVSFGGPVTYKNAKKTIEVLKYVPIEYILVETDCPYLAPEPFRGKRNHSGYLKYIIEQIARVKGLSFEKVAEVTMENAKKLFNINKGELNNV